MAERTKTVTVQVDVSFEVPVDTDASDLAISFPSDPPVLTFTDGQPVENAVYGGHTTQSAYEPDDDDDFDDETEQYDHKDEGDDDEEEDDYD